MKIRSAEFMTAAAAPKDFPAPGAPEVAFLGRSNVGKSSLLNRLVNRKALARTSSTPGKTRLLNWFRVERDRGELWLVDLPGYGWAKVSKAERQRWQQLIESYLLTPRIMGDRTGLHPVAIIVAIFFWGSALGGILGMILAIPLTAFLVVFWRMVKEKYIQEWV